MELMYPLSVNDGNVAYYGETMGYLILTLIPFSGVFIYSTLLTANDSLRKMNRLFLLGIVVNVGLNLLLIPIMEATGAAFATFATQTFVLLGMMMLAKKELQLPFTLRQSFKIMGFMALTIFACRQISQLPDLNWVLKFSCCILAGCVLAFLFRLINLKILFDLAKKKEGLA
jgi:O-antigen/teichoic acid export membrane protein